MLIMTIMHHLCTKIGMSDCFAYSAPPTAGGRKAEARKGREGMACESTLGVRQQTSRGPAGPRVNEVKTVVKFRVK